MSLKQWFQTKTEDGQKPSKKSYILLIGLIGLLFLLISNIFSDSNEEEVPLSDEQEVWLKNEEKDSASGNAENQISMVEDRMEEELTEVLNTLAGVSNVQVVVQLDSSDLKIYDKNQTTSYQKTDENDQSGGTRTVEDETVEDQTVLIRKNNNEEPLLIQTKNPRVRGVLITAEGVDQIQSKQMVIDAVSRLLDVSTHRIAVMPKSKEE